MEVDDGVYTHHKQHAGTKQAQYWYWYRTSKATIQVCIRKPKCLKRIWKLNRIALQDWRGTCRWKGWKMVLDKPIVHVLWDLAIAKSHKIIGKVVCCSWLTSSRSCWPFRGQRSTEESRTKGSERTKQKNVNCNATSWVILQEFLEIQVFIKFQHKGILFRVIGTLLLPTTERQMITKMKRKILYITWHLIKVHKSNEMSSENSQMKNYKKIIEMFSPCNFKGLKGTN